MIAPPDDVQLLRAGDSRYFRALVERHSPRLLAIARSFTDDVDEAHDLVQDVWLRVFEKRQTFTGRGSALAWICTICYSVCADRTRRGRPRRAERMALEAASHTPEAAPQAPRATRPDVSAERSDLRRALHSGIAELTERERSVLLMRLVEGRSTRETADSLDCAEGTVKATLHHAVRKLQRHLRGWEP